jgi:hypothetical protein
METKGRLEFAMALEVGMKDASNGYERFLGGKGGEKMVT